MAFGRAKKPAAVLQVELTPELIQTIAVASIELTAKNRAAAAKWGIGTADTWSADLATGRLSFSFPTG